MTTKLLARLFFILSCVVLTSVSAAKTPKFSVVAMTATTVNITSEGSAHLLYRVTNNTKASRTLTMLPIQNVTQITDGTGYCGTTFSLSPQQSCTLALQINGSELSGQSIIGGPIVCKTMGPNNPAPNMFLCSGSSEADQIIAQKMPTAGQVKCWGYNADGQLGNGKKPTNSWIPDNVVGLDNATQLAGGYSHTCALRDDGTVSCWGDGGNGQLGQGDNADHPYPVQVKNLNHVTSISAAYLHSCALKDDKTVWCWGYNAYGALGDGTNVSKTSPVQVVQSNLGDVAAISGGGTYHYCALKTDGTAWCWGVNTSKQIGNAAVGASTYVPVKVDNLTDVVQVAIGSYHSCALQRDGTAWCWGANSYGQLGNPSFLGTKTSTPQQVALDHIVSMSAGYRHTCAKRYDGTVYCWGDNSLGELGIGDPLVATSRVPVKVSNLDNVVEIATPFFHNCALKSDSTLWCWGHNSSGAVGNNTNTGIIWSPVQVDSSLGQAINIARRSAERYFTCAITVS